MSLGIWRFILIETKLHSETRPAEARQLRTGNLAVPEPFTLALTGLGLLTVAIRRCR
jgi:hypothetical protein